MQGLYQRQLAGSAPDTIGADLEASPGYGHADEAYFRALWPSVAAEYDALVATLTPYLDRAPQTVSPVERAILVIAAWELMHRLDIPYRVVIDEAVDLARDYGGTEGHRFVNGVLDKLAGTLRADEIRALAEERAAGATG